MPKGPVTDEHLLIVPKQHIAHSLDFTASQADSYQETVASVLGFLNSQSMDYILFERNMPFKFA
jgi:diadenosine tetraphosphate (Ap4A) HIT family hydrolase